jgi:L-ascorbate metabolism protein UlaG (beta-lactamase superfamily)
VKPLSEMQTGYILEYGGEFLKVTYIANEGFLVSFSGKKILIDSLFGKNKILLTAICHPKRCWKR